ncbi:MAG: hypothetical protein ACJ0HZ_06560 [Woeseiaceae bacterium]
MLFSALCAESSKKPLQDIAYLGHDKRIYDDEKAAFKQKLIEPNKSNFHKINNKNDKLSEVIFNDFYALLELWDHADINRIEWIKYLKNYLAFVSCIHVLSQQKIIIELNSHLKSVFKGKKVDIDRVYQSVSNRHQNLFVPDLVAKNIIDNHLVDFFRARVEFNLLIAFIEKKLDLDFSKQQIVMTDQGSKDQIPIDEIFNHARTIAQNENYDANQFDIDITKSCEEFNWFNSPLKGVGKNRREFFYSIRKSDAHDDGYLLEQKKHGNKIIGYVVFPGQNLIELMMIFANSDRNEDKQKLVLNHLEKKFECYGINFTQSKKSTRNHLILSLQNIGMLKGSPDAQESAELYPVLSKSKAKL